MRKISLTAYEPNYVIFKWHSECGWKQCDRSPTGHISKPHVRRNFDRAGPTEMANSDWKFGNWFNLFWAKNSTIFEQIDLLNVKTHSQVNYFLEIHENIPTYFISMLNNSYYFEKWTIWMKKKQKANDIVLGIIIQHFVLRWRNCMETHSSNNDYPIRKPNRRSGLFDRSFARDRLASV